MGQRDVARAVITRRIAPEWRVLHADLERMTTRSKSAEAPHDHPSLHPQPEEQRALVVQMAIGAGLLSETADVAAEVRRALALTTPDRGWHELSMLLHAVDRAGIAIPDRLRGDIDAAQRANNARNAERAETQQATAHRPRRRTTTTRRPVSDPAVPSTTARVLTVVADPVPHGCRAGPAFPASTPYLSVYRTQAGDLTHSAHTRHPWHRAVRGTPGGP